MKSLTSLKKILAPVVLTLPILSLPAQADSWVKNISISKDGIVAVSVKNMSANKSVQNVNLSPQTQDLTVSVSGGIDCDNNAHVHQGILQFNSESAWGKMNLGTGNNLNHPGAQYKQSIFDFTPALQNGPNSKNFNQNWKIPLAQVKQGNNSFDPVKIVQDGLQAFQNNGGSAVDFYRKNRSFSKDVRISLIGSCGKAGNGPATWGINGLINAWMTSVTVPVMVNYQGDPGIFALNAQLGNSGFPNTVKAQPKNPPSGPNQFENGYNPLVITDASLQAHNPQYRGQCPKDLNFVVRYRGTGKGMVRYHIVENGKTVHTSAPLPYDNKFGWRQNQFSFEIPTDQQQYNKTVNRKFRLLFEVKEDDKNTYNWNQNTQLGSLNWSHHCQAQAIVPTAPAIRANSKSSPARALNH
ncbi:hypothetical protein [Gilvimarinus sp. 1_MG-2023]|uniref:hypothetical protein n=1 Tax=Gilvimarinus sp. 1_MG-2023 TaxID=3062638 RepID=UPI0026E1691C|nr:hypothetical protein [Gilvimarinus sp. 1_MG-2023]MDO6746247.1 hypothetical protein [Gilvimarinus sp. 1_MG-2023]